MIETLIWLCEMNQKKMTFNFTLTWKHKMLSFNFFFFFLCKSYWAAWVSPTQRTLPASKLHANKCLTKFVLVNRAVFLRSMKKTTTNTNQKFVWFFCNKQIIVQWIDRNTGSEILAIIKSIECDKYMFRFNENFAKSFFAIN